METIVSEFKLLRDCVPSATPEKILLQLSSPVLGRLALSNDLSQSVPDASTNDAQRIQGVAAAIDLFNGAKDPLILVPGATADSSACAVCFALLKLSNHLANANNSLTHIDIKKFIETLDVGNNFEMHVQSIMPAIGDTITILLVSEPVNLDYLADATRLWIVGVLVIELLVQKHQPNAAEINAALSRKLLVPPQLITAFPRANVQLIKAASVSDLYVVRSEWRGYTKGEIAALKNLMVGETLKQSNKETHENELTQVTETQQSTEETKSEETRSSSELSREVASQLSASLQAKVDAEVTGAFPGGTYRVGANAEGNIGISTSERLATRTAQEAVTKAASRVDSSVRTQRTTRELVKLENTFDYELSNPDSKNRRGIYRWLDRVERFQVFKIPDRLQLEFQLPNPAEFYKYRLHQGAQAAASGNPPAWKVTLETLPASSNSDLKPIVNQSDADALATLYRASDLPPMPKETISITDALMLEAKNMPDNEEKHVVSPVASGALEIVIPDGYEAVEVMYFMSGSPARGKWIREKSNNDKNNAGYDETDPHVFHSIVLEAFIGGKSQYKNDWLGEDKGLEELFTTQGSGPWLSPNFGNAYARSSDTQSIKFVDATANPPYDHPLRVKFKLGFRAVGAAHMQVGVQVICRRTAENYASWRQQVFDILFAAWAQWNRQSSSAQETAAIFGTAASTEQSPAKNRELIQEELKRQVISWLLEEVPFNGRPAMEPEQPDDKTPWREFKVDKAIEYAPFIQFFEQAFDWPNMGWIFYPYYWAGKNDWLELAAHEAADPEYERFMRSGSVRVLVPVRSSFEDAVNYWLVYKKPFLGRGLPLPGDYMFVSVATEIMNLTKAPTEGEPVGHAWDTKTATTYVWLEDDSAVPFNKYSALGLDSASKPILPIRIEQPVMS